MDILLIATDFANKAAFCPTGCLPSLECSIKLEGFSLFPIKTRCCCYPAKQAGSQIPASEHPNYAPSRNAKKDMKLAEKEGLLFSCIPAFVKEGCMCDNKSLHDPYCIYLN